MKDAAAQQIEVTRAMVDAAWSILDAYDHDYSDAEKCLSEIYRAMEMARRFPTSELMEAEQ